MLTECSLPSVQLGAHVTHTAALVEGSSLPLYFRGGNWDPRLEQLSSGSLMCWSTAAIERVTVTITVLQYSKHLFLTSLWVGWSDSAP